MKKMKKKKNLNKSIFCILTVFVLLFALAIPCFAWEEVPITSTGAYDFTYGFYFTLNSDSSKIVACAYGNDLNEQNYLVLLDTEIMDIIDYDFISRECTYHPLTLNIPSVEFAQNVIFVYQVNSINSSSSSLETLYNEGYNSGYETGFEEGKAVSFENGYNKGLEDGKIAENTLLTLFSAPTYILSTVFNFEIFGINVYTIVCFVLTLGVVAFILKRVL